MVVEVEHTTLTCPTMMPTKAALEPRVDASQLQQPCDWPHRLRLVVPPNKAPHAVHAVSLTDIRIILLLLRRVRGEAFRYLLGDRKAVPHIALDDARV
eukprot:CAMPEP_0182834902 /NCGR_PEP_ID=MMETSP0006_2-20121128/21192_1 /TAXON_ID=97485 /ORGANISM="Prymnesium parvum, Strain Texoma1" /LENGTH=97 /DNA_ID=CAMNT_0024963239 /DNA_START=362 /DNA_END=655 /DNA_ORIENTATION=+